MRKIQVEELEPRRLFSATSISSPGPPDYPTAADPRTAALVEHALAHDFDGSQSGLAEIGAARGSALRFDGAIAFGPYLVVFIDFTGPRAAAVPGSGPDFVIKPPTGGLGAAEGLANLNIDGAATPSAPQDPPAVGALPNVASGQTLAGIPAGRPTPQLLATPPTLPALAGYLLEGQGLVAARSAAWAAGFLNTGEPLGWPSGPPSPGSAAPSTALAPQSEPTPETLPQFAAPVATALTAVLPVDMAALESGMRQFLAHLERMGEGLAGHGEWTGWDLWIVAGAAAGAACEIARRQLRRPAGGALELTQIAGSPLPPG